MAEQHPAPPVADHPAPPVADHPTPPVDDRPAPPVDDPALRQLLDLLPTAIELRDHLGELVHTNAAAQALLAELGGDHLDGDPWSRLDLVDTEGARLTAAELPVAACRNDGLAHRRTIGVRAASAEGTGDGADDGADEATGSDERDAAAEGDAAAEASGEATGPLSAADATSRMITGRRWLRLEAVPAPLPDGDTGALLSITEVTVERHLEERLRQAALHDPLTELPNRRLLAARFSQAQASAARAGDHLGLIYLDLDRFKSINDVHGHGAGDELLREFGARLRKVTRDADTAARVGGDEFVVLCTHLNSALSLQMAASRIADAVDGAVTIAGRRASLGASVGWVLVGRDIDLDSALNQADTAMYREKARRSMT